LYTKISEFDVIFLKKKIYKNNRNILLVSFVLPVQLKKTCAMAELGNFLNDNDSKNESEINVEMLDYDYIGKCTDVNQLKAIHRILESGKEGFYPHVRVANIFLFQMILHLILIISS